MKRFAVCLLVVGAWFAPAGAAQADTQIIRSGVDPVDFQLTSTGPWAPAVVVDGNSAWAEPIPGTRWISVNADRRASPAGANYRSTFTLPAHVYAPTLSVQARADNGIALSLNGTKFGGESSIPGLTCLGTFGGNLPVPVYTTSSSFGAGVNTLSFLVDNCDAWNETGLDFKATVDYVVVTAGGLCTLTAQMVQGSAKYQALPALFRSGVDALVAKACVKLDAAVAALSPAQKALFVSGYGIGVDFLASASQGYLTAAQATQLKAMAAVL
jgi:hypothetical protein